MKKSPDIAELFGFLQDKILPYLHAKAYNAITSFDVQQIQHMEAKVWIELGI